MSVAVGSLLIDTFPVHLDLTEDKDTGKCMMRGIFGRVDVPTSNGRVYPRKLMEAQIRRLEKAIKKRKVFGLIDHPTDGKTRLAEASHIITGLSIQENGEILGEAEVLNTSKGRDLKEILAAGAEVGVSSRGIGSTRPNRQGHDVVQEDYQLVTWDVVADPAVTDATPKVFFEEDEMAGEAWDVNKLREKFPGLVRKIEEDAEGVGIKKAEDTFSATLDERVQKEIEKLTPKVKETARGLVEKDLRDEFVMKLLKKLDTMRSDIEEKVRSEIQSDPRYAKAKVAMERVLDALAPFITPKTAEEAVKERDAKIEELATAMQKQADESAALQAKLDETASKAREMGYALFVERQLQRVENADAIREMIGNVLQYESVDALAKKIQDCIAITKEEQEKIVKAKEASELQVKRLQQRNESFKTQIEEKLVALQQEVEKLRKENASLEESMTQVAEIGKDGWLRAWVEQQIADHPAAPKLRKILEHAQPKSREEASKLLESLIDTQPTQTGGDDRVVRERIRRHLSSGTETSQVEKPKAERVLAEEVVEGTGITFDEVLRLSGSKTA